MEKLKLNIQLFGGSLSVTGTETDVSIDNNQSYINVVIKATTNSTTYNDSAYLKSATITGQNNTYTIGRVNFKIGKGQTVTVYNGKIGPFDHNTDGTLNPVSISASCYIVSNTQPSASTTVTMSTIPRASSISVADANIGSSTNITINKASSAFTTTLWYKAQGQNNWTKIVDKTSLQVYGWTVPTSFYSIIPNSKTMTCQFYADTYSGTTLIGSSSTITATFTATGNPTISSFTLVDTNSTTTALTGDSSKMVRYASNVKATVSASGQNSASVSSIKINGTTASSGVVNFNSASTNSYQAVVTDSRGYTTSQTKTMTMVNYVSLTLSATIVRNQPTDGKVKISYSGNYFNSSFGSQSNTLSVQYRSRIKNGTWSSWTNLSPTKSGNTYSQSNYQISGYEYTNQYEFQIRAIDKINTVTITGINVSKGQPIYWWNDDSFNVNGLLQYGSAGRSDYAGGGYTYDEYGNMTSKSATAGNNWKLYGGNGSSDYVIRVYPNYTPKKVVLYTKSFELTDGGITTDPTNSFDATVFGEKTTTYRIKPFRNGNTNFTPFAGTYSPSLAVATSDTHFMISCYYGATPICKISGGNNGTQGDKLNWTQAVKWAGEDLYTTAFNIGTSVTISTLNDYKYMEIFYGRGNDYGQASQKVRIDTNKLTNISIFYRSGNNMRRHTAIVTWDTSANTVTFSSMIEETITTSGGVTAASITTSSNSYDKIIRIVGYKN